MKSRRFLAIAALPTLLSLATTVVPAYASSSNPVLQYGATGPAVMTLQTMLDEAGYSVGAGTSKFDAKTLAEVKAFQQSHHLTVDGVVGPLTWAALQAADVVHTSSTSSTSSSSKTTSTQKQPASTGPAANLQTEISVSGQNFNSPSGFVQNDTTYMPIWYVMQALSKINIQNTWAASGWNLLPPANVQVNLNNVQAGSGAKVISINGTVVERVDGIVATDPSSDEPTTYMPIWYVMQVLTRVGLNSTWDGKTWSLPNWSGTSGTGGSGGTNPTPPPPPPASFTTVDLRFPAPGNINASTIDAFLANHPSPMTGLGQSFITAQNVYGVDANYMVAQAILESAWGTSSICQAKNNLFGYGAYDANPGDDAGTFPSEDYAIRFQAWEIRNNYLTAGSSLYVSPTLNGLGVHYATDPQYANSIGSIMNQFAAAQGDSVNSYTQYSSSVHAPTPQSTVEPAFYYNGAQASVIGSQYYNNGLPYYPDMLTGENDMFFGTLQVGSAGSNVKSLQNFLNQQVNAGLTVDGDFGPMTQSAVKQYQSLHNLTVTGVWDFSLWNLIAPSNPPVLAAGTNVRIDESIQGMANGFVTEWDHVVGYGWVDAHYIGLTNVYRAVAQNPQSTATTINVYNPQNPSQVITTLHSGDYVVCSNQTPSSGTYSIQIANQLNGQLITGLIQTSQASLVQVPAPIQN